MMSEELEVYYEKLEYYFAERKFADLRCILLDMEPFDIANYIENNLDKNQQLMFFRLLPKELASDVFVEFDSDTQEELIKAFTDRELKAVIDDMFLDDTVDIIEEMPVNVVKRIMMNSSPENRKQINELLEYPDDSAGSIMNTEYIYFTTNLTVEQGFDKIRLMGINKEVIYTCFVVNSAKKLVGVVTVKDMLLAKKTDLIEDIMDETVTSVQTHDDKESVALKLSQYDFLAMAVTDKEGCLVGVVTVDDAVDVIQEEATEDVQKMAAMLPSERPYLKQSVFAIWVSRVPWLLLLMISSTFTSLILSSYEENLANIASGILILFIPMLMGTAGNAGGQSSVMIIRALALQEVNVKDILKIVWKELRASLLLGLTIGIVCFGKMLLIDNLYNPVTLEVAGIVSGVLCLTIILAKLVGCTLPIFAKICKLDPAVMASPFITTIIDALSLVIYCAISLAILG